MPIGIRRRHGHLRLILSRTLHSIYCISHLKHLRINSVPWVFIIIHVDRSVRSRLDLIICLNLHEIRQLICGIEAHAVCIRLLENLIAVIDFAWGGRFNWIWVTLHLFHFELSSRWAIIVMTFVYSSLLLFCSIGLPINLIVLREPVLGRDLAAAIKCVLVITGAHLIQITRALHLLLHG